MPIWMMSDGLEQVTNEKPLKRKVGLPVSEIILESILTSKSGVFEEIPPVKYPRFKGQDRLGIIFRNRQTISTFKMLEYRMIFIPIGVDPVELRGHLHRTVPISRFAYGPKPVLGVFWPYL